MYEMISTNDALFIASVDVRISIRLDNDQIDSNFYSSNKILIATMNQEQSVSLIDAIMNMVCLLNHNNEFGNIISGKIVWILKGAISKRLQTFQTLFIKKS